MRTLNCGVVFDMATRMSCWTSNRFGFFFLMVAGVENPGSQRYMVANGIKASIARFTRRGEACLKNTRILQGFVS
jgi:hypothetical protein